MSDLSINGSSLTDEEIDKMRLSRDEINVMIRAMRVGLHYTGCSTGGKQLMRKLWTKFKAPEHEIQLSKSGGLG